MEKWRREEVEAVRHLRDEREQRGVHLGEARAAPCDLHEDGDRMEAGEVVALRAPAFSVSDRPGRPAA